MSSPFDYVIDYFTRVFSSLHLLLHTIKHSEQPLDPNTEVSEILSPPTMATYLITGCSRGLGLAMVTDLASRPVSEVKTIFATARKPTQELQQLISKHGDRVIYVPLDVTSRDSCQQAVSLVESELDEAGLDIVINNAACNPRATIDEMEDLEEALEVNVVSVRNMTRAFMPLLRKGDLKKVINM